MTALKLDRIDINILAELQRNGRITNTDLADRVALSASPCLTRIKRLEKSGYITSYNATIALEKLGETTTVFTEIILDNHHGEDFAKFEHKIQTIDEVIECHRISGGFDYLLKFITRGIVHYQKLMELTREEDFGIAKYSSYIVLKSPMVKPYYPLASLFKDR